MNLCKLICYILREHLVIDWIRPAAEETDQTKHVVAVTTFTDTTATLNENDVLKPVSTTP